MKRITDKNYINILGFMRTQLDLKGNELLIYAIIYGFSQDGENKYKGSLSYLAELSGASQKTVITTLQRLCERQLLIKTDKTFNNVKYCEYEANLDMIQITQPYVETTKGYVKTTQPYVETTNNINNINNNIINSKNNNLSKDKLLQKNSQPKSNSRKTKKEKCMDMIIGKLEEYNFTDKVKERILDFYSDRMEKNDYPATNQMTILMDTLSSVKSEFEQLSLLDKSIMHGYRGIFLDNSKPIRKDGIHLRDNYDDIQEFRPELEDEIFTF